MSDAAIRARDLGKEYTIGALQAYGSIRDRFASAMSGLRQRIRGTHRREADPTRLWALRHVDFEVPHGQVLGVIGGNGAGKSTLLKVLARITAPTEGRAEVRGRLGSLLEVGTGFHPDLTGRENVFLNGAILGMRRAEILAKFDQIVAFAEVAAFIDTPVKHYSSGMYVRLAFAVAAHLETEILVVDEVLAVGDLRFQKKCLGQLDEVARSGRTVLFVSHNMDAVQSLCTEGLLLERGRLAARGSIQDVVRAYRASGDHPEAAGVFRPDRRRQAGWAVFTDVRIVHDGQRVAAVPSEADLVVELDLALRPHASGSSLRGLVIEVVVVADDGQPLVSLMNVDRGALEIPATGACTVRMRLPGPTFIPGRYRLNVFLGWPYLEHVDDVPDALEFDVTPPEEPWRPYPLHPTRGLMCRTAEWSLAAAVDDTEPRP
ncbi:MAG: ABC transporter ATP-binding protein [Vicinamibacterales bacterium]